LFSDRCARVTVALAAILAGCEIGETAIAPGEPRLVLHAVLSPTTTNQVILLERSWDGNNFVRKAGESYSTADPIGTGGGYGEVLAEVDVTRPDGVVIRASEPRLLAPQFGAGLYFLSLPGASLIGGGTYIINVRTSSGETLTAHTTVPVFPASAPVEQFQFDRQRDTMRVAWPKLPFSRAFQVWIDGPYGRSMFFTDSAGVRLVGSLRNVNVEGLPRVFLPGFTQAITVAAVDTNYYDYFRSGNHSQTGSGLVNRVNGGIGVFGSSVPIIRKRVQVVAPFTERIEGNYRFFGTPEDSARTLMIGMTVYVESKTSRSSSPDALTGSFRARPGIAVAMTGSFVGTRLADSIRIAFLRNQLITDTIDVFRGRVAGDTIVGVYTFRAGTWRFLKQN
jgi:hypothetical protein